MNGRISKADIRIVLKRVGLDPDMKKPVGKYSLGMRQRLGIAQAIMEDPLFLILDEPFNGLDKHGVEEIRELLLDLKAAGKTILLASHNEEDIRILCDHVYEMDGGILRERTADNEKFICKNGISIVYDNNISSSYRFCHRASKHGSYIC